MTQRWATRGRIVETIIYYTTLKKFIQYNENDKKFKIYNVEYKL